MARNFKKVKENFICEHCEEAVIGNGYTNHCPKCLWSKHVDITPGDRAEDCAGLMKPENISKVGDDLVITHLCLRCGHRKNNKTDPQDMLSSYFDQV
jgi:hypothetical protein